MLYLLLFLFIPYHLNTALKVGTRTWQQHVKNEFNGYQVLSLYFTVYWKRIFVW